MPTTKNKKSKKNRSAEISRMIDEPLASARHSVSGLSAKDIALPAAAVVGAGAIAAAGFVMRREIASLVESLELSKRLDPERLLGFAGLARKRSFLSYLLPELGGFAVGIGAGAALMLLRPSQLRGDSEPKTSMAPGLADVASMTNSGIGAGPHVHPVP
jgi:hypothetical protein